MSTFPAMSEKINPEYIREAAELLDKSRTDALARIDSPLFQRGCPCVWCAGIRDVASRLQSDAEAIERARREALEQCLDTYTVNVERGMLPEFEDKIRALATPQEKGTES